MPSRRIFLATLPIVLVTGVWVFGWSRHHHANGVFGVFPAVPFAGYLVLTYAGLATAYVLAGKERQTRRTRTFQVGGVTLALLLCGILLELPAAVKLIDYRAFLGYTEDWDPVHNQVDPELITSHRPHGRLTGRFSGAYVHTIGVPQRQAYDVDVRWDGKGFRNADELATADVVVLGDSFVESPLVAYAEIATSRLAQELGVTVLNLGQSGFGPRQEVVVLKRHGLPARPRVVVWVLYEGNDFEDGLTYQEIMAMGVDQWARSQDTFWKRSLTRSALTWAAQQTRQQAVWRAFGAKLYGTLTPAGEAQGERMYFSHNRQLFPVEDPAAVASTRACISQANQACQQNGTKLLLAFAPEPFRVYHDLVQPGPDSQLVNWQINDLPAQLGEWAASEGIPYLNLTPMLHQAAREGTLVYFLDDPHWTAAGNAVVGKALAKFCKQHLEQTKSKPP